MPPRAISNNFCRGTIGKAKVSDGGGQNPGIWPGDAEGDFGQFLKRNCKEKYRFQSGCPNPEIWPGAAKGNLEQYALQDSL